MRNFVHRTTVILHELHANLPHSGIGHLNELESTDCVENELENS